MPGSSHPSSRHPAWGAAGTQGLPGLVQLGGAGTHTECDEHGDTERDEISVFPSCNGGKKDGQDSQSQCSSVVSKQI